MYAVRFSPEEEEVIEQYQQLTGLTVSEIIRRGTMEMIDEELDLDICRKALDDYKKNPITYSHEEMMKRLGLK